MKHLGQTQERKLTLTIGLRIVMTKSVKTLRMTRVRRLVVQQARRWDGASNKYTFRTFKSLRKSICESLIKLVKACKTINCESLQTLAKTL